MQFFAFLLKELRKVIAPTLFFAIGFNLIALTTQLILADYLIHFANFLIVTMSALIVGKAVLVTNALPFFHRFDTAPVIQPVLFKATLYWAVVFLVRFLEKVGHYFLGGGTWNGIAAYVENNFSWNRFIAIQIWIFILFLVYSMAAELNSLFGSGELLRTLFARRSSEHKLNRRQRVRTLVKLSQLVESHTLEELRDRTSSAHKQMIELITHLASPAPGAEPSASPRSGMGE
jgi:hypothetical protein